MKSLTISTIFEQGRDSRCFKVEFANKGNNYTLYTSNLDLIERVRAGDKRAIRQLERLTKPNDSNKRVLIPILAILGLYVCSYPTECNSLQIWGYIVGLIALIGLGVIVYKYSE